MREQAASERSCGLGDFLERERIELRCDLARYGGSLYGVEIIV
jgi:hypothetical protein